MSLFTDPPTVTKGTFKRGDIHLGVWALQRFLNVVYEGKLAMMVEDGWFGQRTEDGIRKYQADTDAIVDGVVGPQTQSRMVRSCIVRAPFGMWLPRGLLEGIVDGESGGYIMAVNASVPGGLDLGFTQRRVYGPPFNESLVKAAADPIANISLSVTNENLSGLYDRFQFYKTKPAKTKGPEYVWRLAALAHNWPWAASQLANNIPLSSTKEAGWVPASVRWPDDGTPVNTYAEWAAFYAMGSSAHSWPGYVTGKAFGVPSW